MYDRCSVLEIERVINLGWVTISDYEILGGNCEFVEDQIRFELDPRYKHKLAPPQRR